MASYDQNNQGILLESGTNEVEILEFILNNQSFGVNVAKIKQIVQYEPDKRSELPESPDGMMGIYLLRDVTFPLINLSECLKMPVDESVEKPLVMVSEFNLTVCGFYIDGVKRIHRLSWSDIEPMNEFLAGDDSCIISSATIEENEVLIIDLEHIIAQMGIVDEDYDSIEHVADDDGSLKIVLAEDSAFIRRQVAETLHAGGYGHVEEFSNGQDALDGILAHISQAKKDNRPITDYMEFVITDIKMPKMDGLTLCRSIKEHPITKNIPVAVYSSLITDQMAIKCKQVGANYYMCKPQLADLMKMLKRS